MQIVTSDNNFEYFNVSFMKYCTIDLSNCKKLENYSIEKVYKNIIYIKDKKTNLIGVRYIDSKNSIDTKYKKLELFGDNLFIATLPNGEKNIIDNLGNCILNGSYNNIYDYKNGYAVISYNLIEQGVVDLRGNEIIECKYHKIEITDCGFIVTDYDFNHGLIGFDSKIKIPIKDWKIKYVGFKIFMYGNIHNYGLIDCEGRKVLKRKYSNIELLSNDRFFVSRNEVNYIVNGQGKVLCELSNDCFYLVDHHAHVITAPLKTTNIAKHRFKELIINDGEKLLKIECDYISSFVNDVACIKRNSKYYLIDNKGSYINSISYDKAYIKNDILIVEKDNEKFYIDNSKNVVKLEKGIDNNYIVLLEISDNCVIVNDIDGKTKFIYNNEIIDTNDSYNNAVIYGDYVICYMHKFGKTYNALYTKDGVNIIPLIEDEIYVLSKSLIVIREMIIDLSCEFLDLEIKYVLKLEQDKKVVTRIFDSDKKREKYIYEFLKYKNELQDEISFLKEKIKMLKRTDIQDIDNNIKNSL